MATSNERTKNGLLGRFEKPIASLTLAGTIALGAVGLSACGPSAKAEKVPETPSASAPVTPGATETAPAPTETAAPVPIDKPSENPYSDPTEVQLSFNTPNNPNNLSFTTYPFTFMGKEISRDDYIKKLEMPASEYNDPKKVALDFVNTRMNDIFLSAHSKTDFDATRNPTTNEVTFMPSPDIGGGVISAQHFFYEPAYAQALFNPEYLKGEKAQYPQGINMLNASAGEFARLYSMSVDPRGHSTGEYHMGVMAGIEDIKNVYEAPVSQESSGYYAQVTMDVHFEDNGDETVEIGPYRASGNLPAKWQGTQEMQLTFAIRDGKWILDDIGGLDFEAAVSASK